MVTLIMVVMGIRIPAIHTQDPAIHTQDLAIHNPDLAIHNPDLAIHNPDLVIRNPDLVIRNPAQPTNRTPAAQATVAMKAFTLLQLPTPEVRTILSM